MGLPRLAFGSRRLWNVALILIVLVGFSRLYLGAHFLGDVVGGYAIGFLLVLLWGFATRTGLVSSLPRGVRLFFALLVPVALFPVYQSSASFQTLGFLLGFAASDIFALDLIPYDPRGGALRQVAKMLLGLAGMAALYVLHRQLPDGAAEALGYAVMSVWITVVAPWLFVRLGLAHGSEPSLRRGGAVDFSPVGGAPWMRRTRLFAQGRMQRPLKASCLSRGRCAWRSGRSSSPMCRPSPGSRRCWRPSRRAGSIVVGHRGAAGLAPENTWSAIDRGLAQGVDMIEVDVHLTADGHLVLMHDASVDRTTDGSGLVSELTLAEIESLDAGYRFSTDGGLTYPMRGMGVRVPTLQETLLAYPTTRFIIEIKGSDTATADAVAKVLEARRGRRPRRHRCL